MTLYINCLCRINTVVVNIADVCRWVMRTQGRTWAVARGLSGSSQGTTTGCSAATTNVAAAPARILQNVRDIHGDQK